MRRKPKRKTAATTILDYLADHQPATRIQIREGLGLAESTVRRAIDEDLNLHTERRITEEGPFEYVHRRRSAPPNPFRKAVTDGTACDRTAEACDRQDVPCVEG